MSVVIHERQQDDGDIERYSKRAKLDEEVSTVDFAQSTLTQVLPHSHALLGLPCPVNKEGQPLNFHELDVGISEYIGRGDAKIEGIIKQRFTDFLVFEVDLDGKVNHLNSIGKPASPSNSNEVPDGLKQEESIGILPDSTVGKGSSTQPNGGDSSQNTNALVWQDHFSSALAPFLDEERIQQVKDMFLQGRNPPRVSDSGWAGRKAMSIDDEEKSPAKSVEPTTTPSEVDQRHKPGGRNKTFETAGSKIVDDRKVVSEPMTSKNTRTAFHKVIRELFCGKLETETDPSAPEGGARITMKWSRSRGQGRSGRRNDAGGRSSRSSYPPYIHFTMQKTNRDTQDALGHLSRLLHVGIKDLSVAGTKDKRGVTVQRVSLLRNNKTVEDVWRLANNVGSRRTTQDALSQRGERGIRIADLDYRKASLELGMLKGNAFVITLRNVRFSSKITLDETMHTLKTKGFINYYGMQRFGTASVPTHSIGLALLRSEWQSAADLILQKRYGEHPDVGAARDAWLKDRDLDKALSLFPRRVVAERCILESFKKQKGDTRNIMGAISTIPKNLRLMYIHAYQSYIWNAIVSERLRLYGSDRPVVGDLVFEEDDGMSTDVQGESIAEDETENVQASSRRSRKAFVAPRVRTLTEDDLHKYTIFDVIMPLPGTDVAYPGGALGEKYRQFLRMDGLDPDNWVRKQKEYTLSGSYRKILHLPKEMSWSLLRYTDPDVPLAQADEDKLLGFGPPAVVEDGKFMALQIYLSLGTAAYATMALREITKMDTSSHFQSNLTVNAEDQLYRGSILDEGETEDAG